jgi:periplasmic protein TonB
MIRNFRNRSSLPCLRKPNQIRFKALVLNMPITTPSKNLFRTGRGVTAIILTGISIGAMWPQVPGKVTEKEEIIIMEELATPTEKPPALTDPQILPPPPPELEIASPPQFGLEDDALSPSGDMAVATGNTLMKAADSIVAPPVPSLPAAPIFVDQAPRILQGDAPEYPASAIDKGLEGEVIALITIDTTGQVTQVNIEKSAGSDFDHCVTKSAYSTRFQAPIRKGHKVAARFRRPFEFNLE